MFYWSQFTSVIGNNLCLNATKKSLSKPSQNMRTLSTNLVMPKASNSHPLHQKQQAKHPMRGWEVQGHLIQRTIYIIYYVANSPDVIFYSTWTSVLGLSRCETDWLLHHIIVHLYGAISAIEHWL